MKRTTPPFFSDSSSVPSVFHKDIFDLRIKFGRNSSAIWFLQRITRFCKVVHGKLVISERRRDMIHYPDLTTVQRWKAEI